MIKTQESQGISQSHEIFKSLWCIENPVIPVLIGVFGRNRRLF